MKGKWFLILAIFFGCSSLAAAADSLTWEDCLKEASRNHPDLIAAKEGVSQAQLDKKITLSAALPQFSADVSASTSNLSASGSGRAFSYGLSGDLLLFDGFKTFNAMGASSENIKASQQNFRYVSASVRLNLREAFVNLLKAQQLMDLTQEIYKLRKSNLELITLRYESGTEHKGALLTAKANLSQAVFEINAAKRGLINAQKKLSTQLGREQFSTLSVQGTFEIGDDLSANPDFEKIVENNPSLLQIAAQKNAARFAVSESRGDFLPSVVLSAGAQKSDDQWTPQESATSASVKVSVPLFSGGANVARLSKAQSVYLQLQQEQRSKKDAIMYQLEKSWNDFMDAFEKVNVQKDFLLASEERAKIAQAQYTVGLVTFDNWTIIEDDLVGAKKTFLDIQAAALLAQAKWVQAKGETLEYEN
jgi:outer membrane protein TolC